MADNFRDYDVEYTTIEKTTSKNEEPAIIPASKPQNIFPAENSRYNQSSYSFAPSAAPAVYRWSSGDSSDVIKNQHTIMQNPRAKKSGRGWLVFLATLMSVLFLLSAAALTYVLYENHFFTPSEPPVISNQAAIDATAAAAQSAREAAALNGGAYGGNGPAEHAPPSADGRLSTPDVIDKVEPSVVCIEVTGTVVHFGRRYTTRGVGSGFILTEDGYIVTNYHVVENANEITVTLINDRTYRARLIGFDDASDIAVIKIDERNLPVVELGDSDALRKGEDVVAIGTPMNTAFAGTTTKGIISGINRNVQISGNRGSRPRQMTLLQTDASINPGNSGGPLVNDRGQVIGINTLKLASSDFEGIGFAIPINIAIPIINDIIAGGGNVGGIDDIIPTRIGITGWTITAMEAMEKSIPRGVRIESIDPDGPSHGTGVQLGDIIIRYDGRRINSIEELIISRNRNVPGDEITLTIFRNGNELDFNVILATVEEEE